MTEFKADLVILAAGHSVGADGVIKCLLKHPVTRKNILETAEEVFPDFEVRVVVGYRALEVVSAFPHFSYAVNDEWSFSGNAHSLALAMRKRKTLVLSGDLFVSREMMEIVRENFEKSFAITEKTERRRGNAINFKVNEENKIISQYSGKMETVRDPESLGAFWIGDPDIADLWIKKCQENPNLFAAECLPFEKASVFSVEGSSSLVSEITDVRDFLSLCEG